MLIVLQLSPFTPPPPPYPLSGLSGYCWHIRKLLLFKNNLVPRFLLDIPGFLSRCLYHLEIMTIPDIFACLEWLRGKGVTLEVQGVNRVLMWKLWWCLGFWSSCPCWEPAESGILTSCSFGAHVRISCSVPTRSWVERWLGSRCRCPTDTLLIPAWLLQFQSLLVWAWDF